MKEKSSNLYKPYTDNSDDVIKKLTLHNYTFSIAKEEKCPPKKKERRQTAK